MHIAIDGNEANVVKRVGSNVYAYEILLELHKQVKKSGDQVTVLLSQQPVSDLPQKTDSWRYLRIGPKKFWTQWALPLHLFLNRETYDVLYSPGHYAPRFSPIPYITSVMDTAYLDFPEQFTIHDRSQLARWTEYSVKNAAKVVTISQFTKKTVIEQYHVDPKKIVVAYPAVRTVRKSLPARDLASFFSKHEIIEPYILYVGTIQPRKNLITLIEAFERYNRRIASLSFENKKAKQFSYLKPTQLVLAGKIGWKAEHILERVKASSFKSQIIMPGFVTELQKKALMENAMCQVLLGIHEGFGIPPLEAMKYGTIPIVADATSLPEVVDQAGFIVDPHDVTTIADEFYRISRLSKRRREQLIRKGYRQAKKFSWQKSANLILQSLHQVVA